jgi:DNA-directed RNA polymerase subunit RPC12/RpoP
MKLVSAKCTQCGACLEVDNKKEAAVCNYCGSAFVVEKAINEYKISGAVVQSAQQDYVIRAGTLEKYNGVSSDIVIPDGVTAIANECFASSQITSVVFPDSLRIIGKEAFRRCKNLTSISFPEGLERIGDYAFADCSNLDNVVLPKSVQNLGAGAFACTKTTTDEILGNLSRDLAKYEQNTKGSKTKNDLTATIIIIGVVLFYLLFSRYFFI